MPESRARAQQLEIQRRRGYLALCLSAFTVHAALAFTEAQQGNWRPIVGVFLTLALLLAVLHPRLSLHRMDQLLVLATDTGALFTIWFTSLNHGPLSARNALIFTLFFILWFGVMPSRSAITRSVLLYAAILAIGLTRQPLEVMPLLYLGFVALLVGLMTFAGRQVRQELSETERYASLAMTDPLTGLENRRSMYTNLQHHYAAQDGQNNQPEIALLLADIDHFKNVNDRYGHDIGDQVLQHVAGILRSSVRPGDHVARWGGEEFLIMVTTDAQQVIELIGRRILYTLRSMHSGLPPVTLSIGIAMSHEAADLTSLLRLADQRLYQAKRGGRDQMSTDALAASSHTGESQAAQE